MSKSGIYEGIAQFNYDFVRMHQPHLEIRGLFRIEEHYFMVCRNLLDSSLSTDGTAIDTWVADNTTAGLWIQLVKEAPVDAQPIAERSHVDFVNLVGKPRTLQALQTDLEVLLPKDFPEFLMEVRSRRVVVITKEVLIPEYQKAFIKLLEDFKSPLSLFDKFFETDSSKKFDSDEESKGVSILASSKTIRKHFNVKITSLYESDQDFWIDNRVKILTEASSGLDYAFPKSEKSRCIVDGTSFSPKNARLYLSIYETIVLALPLQERYENFLNSFGISEDELLELIRLGKIEPILPQNLMRYPISLVEKIAELEADDLTMPRRLLTYTILDGRRRYPLLFPPFNVSERCEILRILHSEISSIPSSNESRVLSAFLESIFDNWINWEDSVSAGGLLNKMRVGLGNLGSKLYSASTGENLLIELMSTASLVEWASIFQGVAFPFTSDDYDGVGKGYSNAGAAAYLSSIYTGIPAHIGSENHVGKVEVAVKEILAVSNDEPILQFINSFGDGDIQRLRRLINDISARATTKSEVEEIAENFNKMVKSYSSRTSKLDSFEIMGIIDLVPSLLGASTPLYITGGALVWRLLNKQLEDKKADDPIIRSVFDSINALLRGTSPHAVLVHRSRVRRSKNLLQKLFKL